MPADADESPAELRIGRWLPAVGREEARAENAPTVSLPTVAGTADAGAEPSAVHGVPAPAPRGRSDASPEPAPAPPEPSDTSPEPAPAPADPSDASREPALPPPIPPNDFPEVAAPGRRRTRDLAVVVAVTLAVAAVAATAVALQAKPSGTGGEAAAPTMPTVLATPAAPNGASPHGTAPATAGPTPSATSPAPTPTPSGSPSATPAPGARLNVSVEAEAPSTVLGGRTRIQAMAGASGGAVVSRIGGGAVHYVRFAPITVAESATYTLTIHYVSDATRRAAITVDGAAVATVTCPASGGVGSVSVQVPLDAGANTIEYGNDYATAPDLDRISLVS